ncbi:MAG: VWA domain-containing protein [Candidatus Ozemobacteraceae bacterium]
MADGIFENAAKKLSSHKEDERKEAVLALLKLRDPRAIDLLANVTANDQVVDVRYNARKAYYLLRDIHPNKMGEPFLEMPDGISLEDLEKLLLDENPRIRGEAIKLAGKLDPGSVAPTLRTAIAAEKTPQLLGGLLLGLGRAGLKYDIPSIAGFLTAPEPQIRTNAIEALGSIGGSDALEYVVPLLRDPDSGVRASATKALPPLDSWEMLNILRDMAMSPNVAYRDAAIDSLQRFKAPLAAKILGHLAAVDPVIPLREKARAGLVSMATSDENARKVLEQLNTPEEPDDPNAPATVPLDGIWETMAPDTAVPTGVTLPGVPAKPRVMVVPGLTKKLVKEICLGDQALRENGLRQLASLLKPEHLPFLLLQLDREKDPRIASHLLSLIGKTQAPQAYAAVIKRFKDADNRIRANAIEAAMKIDPNTTPDRISSFLSDPSNRVRANTIIASAIRPNFDPLVWVRDLAGFSDPAYRRSALYVISNLKRPSFLVLLEFLIQDDDMEIRHMAYKAILEYADRKVRKAKELAEVAEKLMGKENKLAGLSDQDFHAAMVAMRAPSAPKRAARKSAKSTTEEFGEQLLGTDNLKKAGQSMKNLKDQAKVAREKFTARMSQTKADFASVNWMDKLWIVRPLALVVILLLHATGTANHFRTESALRLISLGAAVLAGVSAILLTILRRPGTAGILALVLLLVPTAASRFDIQDSDLTGGPRVVLSGGTIASLSSDPASRTSTLPLKKPLPGKTASAPLQVRGTGPQTGFPTIPAGVPAANGPTVRLIQPANGVKIIGEFVIKAKVTGKIKSVEFLLDDTSLKTIDEKREGIFEHRVGRSNDQPAGRHAIKARVTDTLGHRSEDLVVVEFMNPLAGITIVSPANGGVFWRDDRFAATVAGKGCEQVEFLLDDVVITAFPAVPAEAYEYPVPIATLSEGMHTFEVRATMADGRLATDSVRFKAMVPQPTVRFLAPKDGENVFGAVEITIEANSGWKQTAIKNVAWFADGMEKKAVASSTLLDVWDTGDLIIGPHELKVTIENEVGRTAEAVIRPNVIQPKFSVTIKGIRTGQVLTEDTQVTVAVANESPGTKIKKVIMSIDDKPFQEASNTLLPFTIRVNDILPGSRKLAVEAIRSDGRSFKNFLPFSVNLPSRRSLFFTAQNEAGKLFSSKDLEKISLNVKEDGKVVGSYTLQPAEAVPLHFGLLIDVSAGMKSDQKLAKAQEAVSAFIDSMKPQDRAFLVKFSDTPEVVVDFTEDRTRLQQEIEYLTAQRGTALFDAIYLGVEASSSLPEHTVMVVLAAGGDTNAEHTGPGSKHSQAEIIESARRHDVQILTVGVGTLSQSPLSDGEAELRALSKPTAGRYYSVPTAAELPAVFGTIMRDVRDQAKLSFLSPSGPPDGKWHTLEITAPERKDLKFIYKPGYQAK